MLGATHSCHEGAVRRHRRPWPRRRAAGRRTRAGGRGDPTDFIHPPRSWIALEVAELPFVPRLIVLVIVALVITAAVYAVSSPSSSKFDDVGLRSPQTAP